MKDQIKTIFAILIFIFSVGPKAQAEVSYSLDFSLPSGVKAIDWMKTNGFELRNDADDLVCQFKNGALQVETKDDINGIFTKEIANQKAGKIRIEWGINRYPKGANWEKGIYREAIGVVVSFGTEKIDSGSFVVPNVPYFIGIFLGETEIENKAYVGNYFKKGGRYFCQPCRATPGETVVTEFDLAKHFKEQFKKDTVPPITSISIEADTRDTNGLSSAFIKRIELLTE